MFFECLDIAKDFNKSRMKNDHKIMIVWYNGEHEGFLWLF
jgi:hypothetical protein